MKFSKRSNCFYFVLFLAIFYALSYCYLFIIKGGVYGSDVLHISNMVKNLGAFTPLTTVEGFPTGFLIILQAESKLLHTDIISFAQINISLFFIAIFALVFLFSFAETKNRLGSILASFIAISVCPFATIMSPQYLQEVTPAAIVLLSSLILLSKYEKNKKPIFLITGLFLALFTIFIHRSTLVLTFITLFLWLALFPIKQKKAMTVVLLSPFIAIFVLLVIRLYGDYIHPPLILSNKKILADYTSTYFMNYIGWELVPFLIIATIFLKDLRNRFSTIFQSFAIVCILFSGIYLTGYSLISTTIAWRATYYMLFISAILIPYVIYTLIKRKRYSLLFGTSSISLLLFMLDRPVQQYIYRAVSGTSPERIGGVPFLFGKFAPYIILGAMLVLLLIASIYYKRLKHPLVRKSFVVLFIISLILVPRGMMSETSFYLMPQNLTIGNERLLVYLNKECSNENIFSDPQTTHLLNSYGLKTWVSTTPLYGPTKEGSRTVAWWAILTDEIFRDYTAERTYEFMKNNEISLIVINEESGRLIDYAANDGKGAYILLPNIIEEFNKRIAISMHFNKMFEYQTEKGGIIIYNIGY